MASCPWWFAWWHRRLRRIDRAWLWPVMRTVGERRYPEDDEQGALLALALWAVFIQQDGQEHWRCACADQDEPPPRGAQSSR